MWFWFVFWVLILFLLFSGGGYYGYRRSYYDAGTAVWAIVLFFLLFWIAVIFAGPYWGYYGYWW